MGRDRGAGGEQSGALNGVELHSTAAISSQRQSMSPGRGVSAGQRGKELPTAWALQVGADWEAGWRSDHRVRSAHRGRTVGGALTGCEMDGRVGVASREHRSSLAGGVRRSMTAPRASTGASVLFGRRVSVHRTNWDAYLTGNALTRAFCSMTPAAAPKASTPVRYMITCATSASAEVALDGAVLLPARRDLVQDMPAEPMAQR